jgi:predicted O-methyltransferase YrrM
VNQPAVLAEHETAEQAGPLLPGLPAASYSSGDLLDEQDEFDVIYHQRKLYNREFGFCLFTAECVSTLAALCKGKNVLEAGSGSGWLADQLAQQGIEITAADWTDYRQPRDTKRGYPIRSVFRLDHHGDAVALLPGSFDVVLLVWPNLGTPFGEQVARAMCSGQVMILEGEEKGGNTATDEFFDVLSADFESLDAETLALNEHHRTFPGLHDRWQILRKK